MKDRELEAAIIHAVAGDAKAMAAILEQYAPLINKASVFRGAVDEELRQQICLKLVYAIAKFEI